MPCRAATRSATAEVACELLGRSTSSGRRPAGPRRRAHAGAPPARGPGHPLSAGTRPGGADPGARLVSLAAGATGSTSARRGGGPRDPESSAPPGRAARRPAGRARPGSPHGSSRSRPWSPTASPTARSPAGWDEERSAKDTGADPPRLGVRSAPRSPLVASATGLRYRKRYRWGGFPWQSGRLPTSQAGLVRCDGGAG